MEIDFGGVSIPITLVLAVVVTVAYVLGRCGRRPGMVSSERLLELERELRRAQLAATKLEKIIGTSRASLQKHQARLKGFKKRIMKLHGQQRNDLWERLGGEIEDILGPTIHLTAQIASAHDIIRYESSVLMTFTDLQTDPLTGVCNRRGLDQSLKMQFGVMDRYGARFSLALLDIDNFKNVNDQQGHLQGDRMLHDVAKLLEQEAREVDIVARYGGDEFIVVMPQTGLEGAVTTAERLRSRIEQTMSITISGGVAMAEKGDTPVALFLRVDSALYSAKNAGRNCVFWHNGEYTEASAHAPAAVTAQVDDMPPFEGTECAVSATSGVTDP